MLYTGKKPKHVTLNLVLRSKSVLCRLCTDKHKSDNRRHFLGGFRYLSSQLIIKERSIRLLLSVQPMVLGAVQHIYCLNGRSYD